MGKTGPPPKRSDQRRRRNKPAGGKVTKSEGAAKVTKPRAQAAWHPVAKRWFQSLGKSGQSAFYEPSDWAVAELIAESISRDLNPQPIGITESGKVVMASIPMKGASLTAYLRAMSSLLVTEGDRRRVQLELERPGDAGDEGEKAGVTKIGEYRARAAAAGRKT